MPQRIRDFVVAALALAAVFFALTLIDERVPEYMKGLSSDIANGRVIQPGTQFGDLVATVVATPALDNFYVVAMLAVGVALFLLMLRT